MLGDRRNEGTEILESLKLNPSHDRAFSSNRDQCSEQSRHHNTKKRVKLTRFLRLKSGLRPNYAVL